MKTFAQLTVQERNIALQRAKDLLIGHIWEGIIEIEPRSLQAKAELNKILSTARKEEWPLEKVKTYIDTSRSSLKQEIDRVARLACEGARYDEKSNFLGHTN